MRCCATCAVRSRRMVPVFGLPLYAEASNWTFDVLQRQATQILERRFHSPGNGIADAARNQDAASRSLRLKAGGDVHAISIEVVTIDDQVAQVQAHTEHKQTVCRLVAVGLGHSLLKRNRGTQRINRTAKLDERTIAGELDQPPTIAS